MKRLLPLLLLSLAAGCRQAPEVSAFPDPERPVAPIESARYADEDARDAVAHAVELSGHPRREVYARALDLAKRSGDGD